MEPRASQVALMVKNPPANAGEVRETGSIPGSGRYPGGGHGKPPQYACLENPMDREAWKAPVHVRMALPASKPSKHTYRLLETASEWSHRGGHIWAVLALSP